MSLRAQRLLRIFDQEISSELLLADRVPRAFVYLPSHHLLPLVFLLNYHLMQNDHLADTKRMWSTDVAFSHQADV